jgi:hypothetical protein
MGCRRDEETPLGLSIPDPAQVADQPVAQVQMEKQHAPSPDRR